MSRCQEDLANCRAKFADTRGMLIEAVAERDALKAENVLLRGDLAEAELEEDVLRDQLATCRAELADCQGTDPEPTHPWRPYADTAIWNTPISNPTIAPNSARLVAQLKADKGGITSFTADDHWSHPVYWAKLTDPAYTIRLTENWGTSTQGMSLHIPSTAKPEGLTVGYPDADGHLAVIQPDGWEYDFWETSWPPSGGIVTARFGGRTKIDGDATKGYATAYGSGLAGGNITGEELKAGEIRHALFMVSSHTNGQKMNGSWGVGSVAPGDYPAMGQRFWLDMDPQDIQTNSEWEATVLEALIRYGAIVGDTGGGLFKGESPLPYTTVGKKPPLLDVRADGKFPVPIPWERLRALV